MCDKESCNRFYISVAQYEAGQESELATMKESLGKTAWTSVTAFCSVEG